MPCRSDYPFPDFQDKTRETAALLIFVYEQLDKKIPLWLVDASERYSNSKATADKITVALCKTIRGMTEDEQNRIVYNGRDSTSRDLADWWEKHQLADQAREEEELKKKKEKDTLKSIFDKLTKEEKQLLKAKLNGTDGEE